MQSFGRKRERLKVQGLGYHLRAPVLLCFWLLAAQVYRLAQADYLATLNKLGPIRGLSLDGGSVAAFLGVPYAAPPVGPLRFMPPGAYSGPQAPAPGRDQTEFGHSCVRLADWLAAQPNTSANSSQSEDCLNANLFVPIGNRPFGKINPFDRSGKEAANHDQALIIDQNASWPIVVLLHGSQQASKANSFAHLELVARLRALIVTFNYRIGLLGFLPFSEQRGQPRNNHAIWDHIGLLHWLKHNVAAFNGNPLSVTLLATDNQAADLARLLAMSPLAKGLFHRLILVHREQGEQAQFDRWLATARDARDSRRRLLSTLNQLANQTARVQADERKLFDYIQFANLSQLAELDLELRLSLPDQLLQLANAPNLDDRLLFPHLGPLIRDGQLEFARPTWQNFSLARAEINYCQYLRQLYSLEPDTLGLVSPRLLANTSSDSTNSIQRGWHRNPPTSNHQSTKSKSHRRLLQAITFSHLRNVHLLGQFLGSTADNLKTSDENSDTIISDTPPAESPQVNTKVEESGGRTIRGLAEHSSDLEQLMALLGSYDLMLGYQFIEQTNFKPKPTLQSASLAGNYSQIASHLIAATGRQASEQFLFWLKITDLHSVSTFLSNSVAFETHCDFNSADKSPAIDKRPRSFAFLDKQSRNLNQLRMQDQVEDWLNQTDTSTMARLANFVATGNPNFQNSSLPDWPVYEPLNRRFRLQTSVPLGIDLRKQVQVYLDLVPYLAQLSSSRLQVGQEQVLQELGACLTDINSALLRTESRIQEESSCIRGPLLQRLRVQLRQLSTDVLGYLFKLGRAQTPVNSSSSSITTRNLISNQSDAPLDASELEGDDLAASRTIQVAYLSPRSSSSSNSSSEFDRRTGSLSEPDQQQKPGIRGFLAKAYRDAIGQALAVVVGTGLLIFLLNLVIVVIIALRSAQARRRNVHDSSLISNQTTANGILTNNQDVDKTLNRKKSTLKNSSPSSNQSVSTVSKQLKFNLPNQIEQERGAKVVQHERMQQQVMLITQDPRGFLDTDNSYTISNQSPVQLHSSEVQLVSSFGPSSHEVASSLLDERPSSNLWPNAPEVALMPRLHHHHHHPACINSKRHTSNSTIYSNTDTLRHSASTHQYYQHHLHHHHHDHQNKRSSDESPGIDNQASNGIQAVQFSHSSLSPSSSTNISTTPIPLETFTINNNGPYQLEPIGLIYDSNQLLTNPQHQQLNEALIASQQNGPHFQAQETKHYH